MHKYTILFLMIFAFQAWAKAQPREPLDELTGKWSGIIRSETKAFGPKGEIIMIAKGSLEILNLSVEEYKEKEISPEEIQLANLSGFAPVQTSFTGWAKFTAFAEFFDSNGKLVERWSLPNKEEMIEVDGHFFIDHTIFIASDDSIAMKQEQWLPEPVGYNIYEHTDWPAFSVAGSPLFPTRAIKIHSKNGTITIDDIWKEGGEIKVIGELYRTEFLKKSFPKDIKPDESIQTDGKTKIEVTLPDVGKVNINQNTNVVFRSNNVLELAKGIIRGMISKLKPKSKFDVHTPTAIIGIRGTEYTLEVAEDGTTKLIVINGEVEVSDKQNIRTQIVKNNQKLFVSSEGIISKPISISPKKIPRWWE